jgi:hypothetical protein
MITRCGCLSSTASITVSPRLHPVKLIHNLFYQQPCLGRAGKAGTHRRKSSDRTCGGGDLKPTFQTQFRGFEADLSSSFLLRWHAPATQRFISQNAYLSTSNQKVIVHATFPGADWNCFDSWHSFPVFK